MPASARPNGRRCLRRPGRPQAVLETLQRTMLEALQVPAARETFGKSYIVIDPTRSLDEARSWLRQEMTAWAGGLAEIKLDVDE